MPEETPEQKAEREAQEAAAAKAKEEEETPPKKEEEETPPPDSPHPRIAELAEQLEAKEAELEELRKAQETEQEKAVREAKEEGRKEALEQTKAERVETLLTAAASDKLQDASLAAKLIDTAKLDPAKPEGITAAVDQLVKDHPYLAKGEKPEGSIEDLGAGAGGGGTEKDPGEMTYEEYKKWRQGGGN